MPLAATHALIPALIFYSLGSGKTEILLAALGGVVPDLDVFFDLVYKRAIHPTFSHSFSMGIIMGFIAAIFPFLIPFALGYVMHLLFDGLLRPLKLGVHKGLQFYALLDGIVILISIIYLFLL